MNQLLAMCFISAVKGLDSANTCSPADLVLGSPLRQLQCLHSPEYAANVTDSMLVDNDDDLTPTIDYHLDARRPCNKFGVHDPSLDALRTEASDACSGVTFTNIDSGCGCDVEDGTGIHGFVGPRLPCNTVLHTGTNEATPCTFQGRHVQYFITSDLRVARDERDSVVCTVNTPFKRCLMAPRTGLQRGMSFLFRPGTRAIVELADGSSIPMIDTGKGYFLRRFFTHEEAEAQAARERADRDRRIQHTPALETDARDKNEVETVRQYALLWHRRLAHRSPALLITTLYSMRRSGRARRTKPVQGDQRTARLLRHLPPSPHATQTSP